MSPITSLDMYDRFVELIDQACDAKDIYRVPKAAESLGLKGGEEQRGMGQRWNFSFVMPTTRPFWFMQDGGTNLRLSQSGPICM